MYLNTSENLIINRKVVSAIYKIYDGGKVSSEDEDYLDEFITNSSWVLNMNNLPVFPTPEEFNKEKTKLKIQNQSFLIKVFIKLRLLKKLLV